MTEARKDAAPDWQRAKESLSHVYWIGGVTAAGKSTIAKKLADDFGLIYYSGDYRRSEHMARATEEEYPAVYADRVRGEMETLRHVLLLAADAIGEMDRDYHLVLDISRHEG